MQLIRYIVIFLCLVASTTQAQSFNARTLDWGSQGVTGKQTSQAVVNGNPAIAYFNESDTSLMFARNSTPDGSGNWNIVTVQYSGFVGQYPSLAVVNGRPAISYSDNTNGVFKYIRALDENGATWAEPLIIDFSTNYAQKSSLVVVNGNPAISYYGSKHDGSYDGILKYIRALDSDGTNWGTAQTVDDTLGAGMYSSLSMVDGTPAISYSRVYGVVEYVRALDANGADWSEPLVVDAPGYYTQNMTLVVTNGKPAIAYSQYIPGNTTVLKFIRAQDTAGLSWDSPLILDDSSSSVGLHASLAIINGNPAVSYYDQINSDLKYMRARDASGTSWGPRVTIDYTGDQGQFTSLAVVNGNPAISYFDATNGNLKFLRAQDATGGNWPVATIVDSGFQSGDVGSENAHAIIDGNPAVSYYDTTNGDLKYVRALDAVGTSWAAPVTIASDGDVGSFCSLTVVNGNPAIAYYGNGGFLTYIRALDAKGISWGMPVIIDGLSAVVYHPSLTVVNGNPAISYSDGNNALLKYVRAVDANGTNWGTPHTLGGVSYPGVSSTLLVVNGFPAISYYDGSNGILKYWRAGDVNGDVWRTPFSFDRTIYAAQQIGSMVIVNGRPAISYIDSNNHDLKYVRALNVDGTSWGAPITVIGPVGNFPSLAVVNGNPSICYYDGNIGDLRYVSSLDPNGANWGASLYIDNSSFAGASSLIAVNGKPAISYYDYGNGNLKWALLSGPDIAISEAGTTSDDSGSVDFGSVVVNSMSQIRTFTIINPGTAELTGLAITGGNSEFVTNGLSGTSIPAGGSVTFTIIFTPSMIGSRSATLHITSNVTGSKNPFDLALTGIGVSAAAVTTSSKLVVTHKPDGSVSLSFHGVPGQACQVQRSIDLQNWSLLTTISAVDDSEILLLDPNPPEKAAFYRIQTPD